MTPKLPKIRAKDLDWKLVFLLLLLVAVNWLAPLLPGIGEAIDIPDVVLEVIVAYILGKRAIAKSYQRQGVTLPAPGIEDESKFDPTAATQPGTQEAKRAK